MNKNIWFTSDTHFSHKNIVRGVTDWGIHPDGTVNDALDNDTRDFQSVDEMNQTIIDNINRVVGPDDILWHAGDWSFGNVDAIIKTRKSINCKNVFLVLGNHDKHIANNKNDVQSMFSGVFNIWGMGWEDKKIGGQRMTICHFPMQIWDKHQHGAWHLHGHSHGNFKATLNRKILDIGIDNHPDFRPWHFDEISAFMNDKDIVALDHHTKRM